MSKEIEEKKMTLEEYQKKYPNSENLKTAKSFLFILGMAIAVIIVTCLFFVVLRLFDIHPVAGYVGTVLSVIFFVFAYVIPVVKLNQTKAFMTNVDKTNARLAQKYNKQLREELADKMIDAHSKVENINWYNDETIGKLAIARHTKNDADLKKILTEIYKSDVRKAANKIIRQSAVKVGLSTALSQSELVDTLFVFLYELNLIKDIVFLYGYRPSEAQMVKIYRNVLVNALLAYGVSTATSGVGVMVGNTFKKAISTVPVVGGIAGTVIGSSIQGLTNSTLAVIIGYQTRRYLIKEYNLQEALDNVELIESEEEEEKLIEAINEEVKNKAAKSKKAGKSAPVATEA